MAAEAQTRVLDAFSQYNPDPNKAIEWESLVHVLKLLGPMYPENEARAALQASGKLLDGKIQYRDFVEWIFCPTSQDAMIGDQSVRRYLVDNSQLQLDAPGLGYRGSANFEDRKHNCVAPWNTEVSGIDCGNGWVDVGGLFLPFEVNGKRVLTETGIGYALGQCKTCTSLGRQPFHCHYKRIYEDCPVQVAQRFESISTEPVWLEIGMRGKVLEVDNDGDRRIQFEDFETAQWVQRNHVLYLSVLPGKEIEHVDSEDILQAFKRCDLRGDGLVHLGALKKELGAEVVDTLAEELDTIGDATWAKNGSETKGAVPQELDSKDVDAWPPHPRVFVRYADLVSWMFDDGVAKAARCKEGHKLVINVEHDQQSSCGTCAICGCVGTTHWCDVCCHRLSGYRLCYSCHQKQIGKVPGFDGRWLKDGALQIVANGKVTFARGDCYDLVVEDAAKCSLKMVGKVLEGFLIDRGMSLRWSDGNQWNRSLGEAYRKERSRVDPVLALKNLRIPLSPTSTDSNSVDWSRKLDGYPDSGWKCAKYSSCSSSGKDGWNPWRWHCEKSNWDLCVHCGPRIPVTVEPLRPLIVPAWHEFLTAGPRALAREAGKFYYELRLGYGMGSPHVGFLTTDFDPKDFDGHGVGTEFNGWAVDGVRHLKWHCGSTRAAWPRTWEIGDVIGAAVDIREGVMMFSLNGDWNQEATLIFNAGGRSFYPAVSMVGNWQMHIPKQEWRFSPPDIAYQGFADGGVFQRPLVTSLQNGDRVHVLQPFQSNSTEANEIIKGEQGTVRYIDEDGDALIDFDGHIKGEWLFGKGFANVLRIDSLRGVLGEVWSDEHLMEDEAGKLHWGRSLVGTWEWTGGSFEIEDRGDSRLYFYDTELKSDLMDPRWLFCVLLKSGISYRIQLNQERGNMLFWQEKNRESDEWESTHYATRRGLLVDGVAIITTVEAPIWSSVASGQEIGVVPPGTVLYLSGPPVKEEGLWVTPLRPRGAIEMRCFRIFEPIDSYLRAVDTNDHEGREMSQTVDGEQMASSALNYVHMDSIWQALATRDTVLVKGSWIRSQAETGQMLPQRQDLPGEACWDPFDLQEQVEAKRVELVAISYTWRTPSHPDPEGAMLIRVAEFLSQWLDCGIVPVADVAVFVDWCSLYQQPRSPDEQVQFDRSLNTMSLWYAHTCTYVLYLTETPEGCPPYDMRGWPTFERRLSSMFSDDCRLVDLGKLDESCTTWLETCKMCAVNRLPPLRPETFNETLASKIFAVDSDLPFLQSRYRQVFDDIIGAARVLDYQGSSWTTAQVASFLECLSYSHNVTKLNLAENNLGADVGEEPIAATSLTAHLPKCTTLKQLLCRRCNIGDMDMMIMAPCFTSCVSLVTVNFQENKFGAQGTMAFANVLPEFPRIGVVYLGGNSIEVEGANALAEYAPKSETLRELWITDCGDLRNGGEYLKAMWKEGGKRVGLLYM